MRTWSVLPGALLGVLDFCNAFFLSVYGFLILGPIRFLRGPLMLEKVFSYARVLFPTRLMSRSIRVAIDWRLGHFDAAIAQAEAIITQVEGYYLQKPDSEVRRKVLADLYTVLTRAYMHAGHIDEAMQVILRAQKSLGSQRLVGLVDLDAKTAHLVRAGLAAGRLLDGSGMATMFIKTHHADNTPKNTSEKDHRQQGPAVSTDTANSSRPCQGSTPKDQGARVIPFPGGHPQ